MSHLSEAWNLNHGFISFYTPPPLNYETRQNTPLINSIRTIKPPSYPVLGGLELSCLDNPLNLANLA